VLLGQGTLIAGRYIVERKIGEGSWGEVWLGHHTTIGMRVAIKALLDTKVGSHDAVVRFEREAKFLGRIQSDYVARVLDFLNDDVHGLILVMELVEGESLADLLTQGPLTVERAIEVGYDLVAGLCDLHAARVVHRDMKPGNVILRPLPDGKTRAVIIDFSLGRLVERVGEESSLTQLTGAFMSVGTLPYMSPEQVLDARKATFASDVYAVGALLFRCVSGGYVFGDGADAAIARKKLTSEAPKLDTGRDDAVAKGLERVVERALRRRPEDRYPDTRAMLTELAELRDASRAQTTTTEAKPAAAATEAADSRESTEKAVSPEALRSDVRGQPSAALLALAAMSLLGAGVAIGLSIGHARWQSATMAPSAPSVVASSAAPSTSASSVPIDATTSEDATAEDDDAATAPASTLPPITADTPPPVRMWRPPASSAPSASAPPTTSAPPTASSAPPTTSARPGADAVETPKPPVPSATVSAPSGGDRR
jgi:serine/threonine-protein kinase